MGTAHWNSIPTTTRTNPLSLKVSLHNMHLEESVHLKVSFSVLARHVGDVTVEASCWFFVVAWLSEEKACGGATRLLVRWWYSGSRCLF